MSQRLRLCIKVVSPPEGVAIGLQLGHGSMGRAHEVQRTDGIVTLLPFDVEVKSITPLKVAGPFVQKDAKGQFVYIRWGQSAGDHRSPWQRRAKIYLHVLTAERIQGAVEKDETLTLVIDGKAKDGGPACPTVPSTLE